MDCLRSIQCELKAPKGQYNSFGKYSYRSCEDILEAVKPLLDKYKATVYITDEAREPVARKGMDEAQVTGATSSYARKYALNGLFLIDDNKDADTDENRNEYDARASKSSIPSYTKEQLAKMKSWTDGTFTEDELAGFRKECIGEDYVNAIERINEEYMKRRDLF